MSKTLLFQYTFVCMFRHEFVTNFPTIDLYKLHLAFGNIHFLFRLTLLYAIYQLSVTYEQFIYSIKQEHVKPLNLISQFTIQFSKLVA